MKNIKAILDQKGSDVVSVRPEQTVAEAVEMLVERRIGCVIVLEADGQIAGILTERDVLTKALAQSPTGWRDLPAEKIMTARPDSLRPEDPMVYVMNRMYAGAYRHVPVVNDANEPTHIVSIRDVLHFMLDHFEPEVSNIPPEPFRGPPKQWGG